MNREATTSAPVAGQLYLPDDWAADAERCANACGPEEVGLTTTTQIALPTVRALLAYAVGIFSAVDKN